MIQQTELLPLLQGALLIQDGSGNTVLDFSSTSIRVVIAGGAITALGSMALQNASAVAISGGTINGAVIGGITPAAATVTTLNGVTVTTGAGAVLTIAAGKTLSISNTFTATATDGSTIALGAGGTVVYTTTAQTLSNKVLSGETDLQNISISGFISMVPETVAGNGAIGALSLTKYVSTVQTTGAATATIADGFTGLCKRINLNTDGGDLVVTVTNLQGGTTITLNDAGDSIDLQYLNGKWQIISNNGCVIA